MDLCLPNYVIKTEQVSLMILISILTDVLLAQNNYLSSHCCLLCYLQHYLTLAELLFPLVLIHTNDHSCCCSQQRKQQLQHQANENTRSSFTVLEIDELKQRAYIQILIPANKCVHNSSNYRVFRQKYWSIAADKYWCLINVNHNGNICKGNLAFHSSLIAGLDIELKEQKIYWEMTILPLSFL